MVYDKKKMMVSRRGINGQTHSVLKKNFVALLTPVAHIKTSYW